MTSIQEYLKEFGLRESDVYLLELIPLIEMIWADGSNQEAELKILYRFTIEHLAHLSTEDAGVADLTEADINRFIHRFTAERPKPAMLEALRELCIEKLERAAPESQFRTREAILNHCLDIAAACAKAYPYKFNERIVQKEKELLHDLFRSLSLTAA